MITTSVFLAAMLAPADPAPRFEGRSIFPPEKLHNHSSCIVECPNGDLLACWYRGTGERKADDAALFAARLRKGTMEWSKPFVLVDTPGYPDMNPCLFVDPRGKLWLFWPIIIANEWPTALLGYKVSSSFEGEGAPRWEEEKVLLPKPGPEFPAAVEAAIAETKLAGAPGVALGIDAFFAKVRRMASDKMSLRLGWMPRAHAVMVDGNRLLLPLYSDGFDFSLMAMTDDWGANWSVSTPLVGGGNVQPSVARRKDGTLAAYMRDNGLPPQRTLYSESRDRGTTWSRVVDTPIFNPGSGLEVIVLADGTWAMVYNDTESGRRSLAVSLSPDEGKTWPWTRHLEPREDSPPDSSGSYPSMIQARDGSLHVTYSRNAAGETIFHAHFDPGWVKSL